MLYLSWQQVLFVYKIQIPKMNCQCRIFTSFLGGIVMFTLFMFFIPFLCLLGARPVAPVSSDPLVTEIGWEDPCCHLQKVKTWKVLFVYKFVMSTSYFHDFFEHSLVLFWFYVQKLGGRIHAVTSKRVKIWKADQSIPWLICNYLLFFSFFSRQTATAVFQQRLAAAADSNNSWWRIDGWIDTKTTEIKTERQNNRQ